MKQATLRVLGFATGIFLLVRHNSRPAGDTVRSGTAVRENPSAPPDPGVQDASKNGPMRYLKRTVTTFMEDDCMTQAAALAYYSVLSLAPLVLTVVGIAGLLFGRESVQQQVYGEARTLIGAGAAEQLQTMVTRAGQHQNAGIIGTVVGLIILLLGATGTFSSLQDALNAIWHVKPDPAISGVKVFLKKRLLSFGILLGVGFMLMVSLILSAILTAAGGALKQAILPAGLSSALVQAAGLVISFGIIGFLIAAIFKILPDAEIYWRDVLIGAVLTSILFTIGKTAIALYLGKAGVANAYGAAGSFVAIIIWLYYGSLILLFGAEFTKTWALRHRRRIEPEKGAVEVMITERHRRS
jgi:membrane protein